MSDTVQVVVCYEPHLSVAVQTIVVAFEQQHGRIGGRNTHIGKGVLTDTLTLYWSPNVVQAFKSQLADKVGKENVTS